MKDINEKYEITDISHPEYLWLHRIRALCDIGDDVKKGALGGFVQSGGNLSQYGDYWIYEDAICCEYGAVSQAATMKGHAIVRETALVSGTAKVLDHAKIRGNAIVMAGTVMKQAEVCGEISAPSRGRYEPVITDNVKVYGEVSGAVILNGDYICLPGQWIINRSHDLMELSHTGVTILSAEKPLEHPEQKQKSATKGQVR